MDLCPWSYHTGQQSAVLLKNVQMQITWISILANLRFHLLLCCFFSFFKLHNDCPPAVMKMKGSAGNLQSNTFSAKSEGDKL